MNYLITTPVLILSTIHCNAPTCRNVFVVMDIGYVQNSIITAEAFYTLMAMCFVLNVALPVSIKLWKLFFDGKKKLSIAGTRLSSKPG